LSSRTSGYKCWNNVHPAFDQLGVSEVRHLEPDGWVPGPDPERRDYGSFADFSDPDGNSWVLQEVPRSEPGA